jgi:hypothetical protein
MNLEPMFSNMPCDACGKDTGCTCPPCTCMWCRARRGDPLTSGERAHYEAQLAQNKRQKARDDLRQSAARMRAKLEALSTKGPMQ